MSSPTSRRRVLGGLSAFPIVASVPCAAAALDGSPSIAGQSDLANAIDWSIQHRAWCDANWETLREAGEEVEDRETRRWGDVYERAHAEPSNGLSDIKAKCRLVLSDLNYGPGLEDDETVECILREVLALPEGT